MSGESTSRAPVLILGVEPRITIPIARSLHRHGVPVEVASMSSTEAAPQSRCVRAFVSLPAFSESPSRFLDGLAQVISKRRYDTLIPATDAALAAVSVHDEYLRSRLRLACPQPQVVQRVLNKSLTLEIAQRCGIHVPRSYIFSDLAELEAFAPDLQYPVVAKPFHKSKETDFKVRYFHSYDQLHEALAGDPELASRVLLQEFCPGDGVGIEMLIHEGEPVATFQHRRLKELPHTGGAAVVAIAEEPDPELVQQALKLLRAIEWEGVAMVEFRFHRPDRRVALMEINGRYWGTLALPIHAGVDFPLYQWQLLHGEMPVVPRHYAVGLVWRWSAGYIRSWHGRLASTAGRPGLWKGLLPSWRDISPATRDALWMMRDPMPALAEAGRALAGLVKADFTAVIKRLGVGRRKDNGLSVEEGHQKAEVHRS